MSKGKRVEEREAQREAVDHMPVVAFNFLCLLTLVTKRRRTEAITKG